MTECPRTLRISAVTLVAVVGTLLLLRWLSVSVMASSDDLFVLPAGSGDCSQSNPCDLQMALSQANDGDTIYVAQGVYTGTGDSVITVTKSITLYGGWDGAPTAPPVRDSEVNSTTLDGEGQRRGAYITGDITPTLEGLRVTNGWANVGGGVRVGGDAHPTISGCRVFSNTADAGGGIYLYVTSNAVLAGNVVYSNVVTDTTGGGIYLWESHHARLEGNIVYGNTSDTAGGIYLGQSDNTMVVDNEVYGNEAIIWSGGGILLSVSHDATLVGNRVYANRTNDYGGGISVWNSHDVSLMGNYVYSNTSNSPGGGIHFTASPTAALTGNHVYDNAASDGGGIYLHDADYATLMDNRIHGNKLTSYKYGGGVYLSDSGIVTLTNNWIYSNTARYGGGGLCLQYGLTVTLAGNHITSNTTANDYGGGIYVESSDVTLTNNVVQHNFAVGYGGGLAFADARAVLERNWVEGNTAASEAGMSFERSAATLVNNVVADNVKLGFPCASGIGIADSVITLTHNTIARNRGPAPGSGIYVAAPSSQASVVTLINNILVSHTVGITVAAGNTATLEATLWGADAWANEADWDGNGNIFTGTINVWADPGFANPDGGDYHIAPGSAAVDRGVDAGIESDIDGDPRPIGSLPDIGADEARRAIFLPLALRNYS